MDEGLGNFFKGWKRAFDFFGRSRRYEFWFFMSGNFLTLAVLAMTEWRLYRDLYLTVAYLAVSLVPTVAVTMRRLHDTGRTGWWLLLFLVPLVGVAVLLYFMLLDSQTGTNRWGLNPKRGPTGHWR